MGMVLPNFSQTSARPEENAPIAEVAGFDEDRELLGGQIRDSGRRSGST